MPTGEHRETCPESGASKRSARAETDGAAEYGDVLHHQARRILESALGRLQRHCVDAPGRPGEINLDAVEPALVERPVELADEPRIDTLTRDGLDLGVAGRELRSGGVRHAPDPNRQTRRQVLQ